MREGAELTLRGRVFRHREQSVQRSWGRTTLGMWEEQRGSLWLEQRVPGRRGGREGMGKVRQGMGVVLSATGSLGRGPVGLVRWAQ